MPNRNRAWADTVHAFTSIAAGSTLETNLLVDAPVIDTITAVCMVVDFTAALAPGAEGDLANFVSVGIGVASVEAFAAGAGSLPSVSESDEYPPRGWLYIASKPVSQASQDGVDRLNGVFQVDLRSMRKVDKGILYMSVHNVAVLGMEAIEISGRVRVLCLT